MMKAAEGVLGPAAGMSVTVIHGGAMGPGHDGGLTDRRSRGTRVSGPSGWWPQVKDWAALGAWIQSWLEPVMILVWLLILASIVVQVQAFAGKGDAVREELRMHVETQNRSSLHRVIR